MDFAFLKALNNIDEIRSAAGALVAKFGKLADKEANFSPLHAQSIVLRDEVERELSTLEANLTLEALAPYLLEATRELLREELGQHFQGNK
jgi:hypothetical protein